MLTLSSTTASSSAVGTTAPPPLLLKAIKEAVARGDRAKVRAENFYITAGQHLKTLKDNYTASWAEWEETLRVRCNLSASRASDLMAIADGRKTVKQVRSDTAQRMRQLRRRQSSSTSRDEENEEHSLGFSGEPVSRPAPCAAPALGNDDAHQLIDVLTASSSTTRATAAQLLISGPRQHQFEPAATAVSDIYGMLMKAGR
jgi:hypothetical protein